MMTLQEISDILLLIAIEYPQDINPKDKEGLLLRAELWHKTLNTYPKQLVEQAALKCLKSSHFCPKLADVCEQVERWQKATLPSDAELWDKLASSAVQIARLAEYFQFDHIPPGQLLSQGDKARQQAGEIYAGLPAEVKRFCGGMTQLIAYGDMTTDELVRFLRPQFIKRLPELRDAIFAEQEAGCLLDDKTARETANRYLGGAFGELPV